MWVRGSLWIASIWRTSAHFSLGSLPSSIGARVRELHFMGLAVGGFALSFMILSTSNSKGWLTKGFGSRPYDHNPATRATTEYNPDSALTKAE